MGEKLISILMPVRNASRYLEPCLRSIKKQSHSNWELIAVNDHSSDNSLEILKAFENEDERVRVLDNSGVGIIHALRSAYGVCRGEFIHRMDADDIMPENKIQLLLRNCSSGVVATGKVKYFSDDWLVGLGFQNYEAWINANMVTEDFWEDLFVECPIPSPAWMITRADLDAIGAFDSDLIPEDYDLCFRIHEKGLGIMPVDEIVHLWRDSQDRTSRKNSDYFPMAYYPLKLHYFLKLKRESSKKLILWGAGKKGKLLSRLLLAENVAFEWITDNEQKIGPEINGKTLVSASVQSFENAQIIVAVASPYDKVEIQQRLDSAELIKARDYWWFC